jgi:hypothetical protein
VCAFQRCHVACETSRDCDNGARCVASDRPFHVCQLGIESQCKVNVDCPSGQVCAVDQQCRDACTTSRDCVKGQECVTGTCADPDELTGGVLVSEGGDASVATGRPCSFNSDCPSGLMCRSRICAPECHSTSDCAPGLSCDNSRCVVPLECAAGDAGSDPRAGGPCLYSSQCPVPLACVNGYCSCECLGAQDCAPGFACVASRCQAVVGGANSVEIGPNGGTVTSSDGKLSMNIPPGAIDDSIVFAVKAATAWPAGAVGTVYEVEPSGTRFAKPATIKLSYAGLDLGARSATGLFVGTATGASWQSLGTAVNDAHAQTVASTTSHLSVFGLVFFGSAASADAGTGGSSVPDASSGGGNERDGASESGTATACRPACSATAACVQGVCVEPDVDAQTGCVGSIVQPPLSPAALGFPANGLVLWVRADRGVYKDDKDGVCAWKDQSGNAVVLRPGAVRPTWEGDGIASKPVIHFRDLSDLLSTGSVLGIGATSARTFIAVDALVKPDGRFHPILQGQGNSAGAYIGIDANTWQTAGNLEGAFITDNSYDTALATTTSPRLHLLVTPPLVPGTALPGTTQYRVNGAAQSLTLRSGSNQVEDFSGANFTAIGDVSSTSSTGVTGEAVIAEALIYDHALTAQEIFSVEASLKASYAVK